LEESSSLAFRLDLLDPGSGPGIFWKDRGGEDISLFACVSNYGNGYGGIKNVTIAKWFFVIGAVLR
jgi:hypothetical protein